MSSSQNLKTTIFILKCPLIFTKGKVILRNHCQFGLFTKNNFFLKYITQLYPISCFFIYQTKGCQYEQLHPYLQSSAQFKSCRSIKFSFSNCSNFPYICRTNKKKMFDMEFTKDT